MLELIAIGFQEIMNPMCLALIFGGTMLGIIFGAIPGLSATMAIALCLPLTYGMEPINGMALLIGLYIGGISGGLVSAILLRIPGTPSSVATCFDGHPLAARGEAGKALGVGIFFSFIGTLMGIIALMFIAPSLAKVALKFSSYEYFSVGVFSITMMCALIKGAIVKGLISGFIGLSIALVGPGRIDGLPRMTFGFHALDGGFDILPLLIGLFAVSEVLQEATQKGQPKEEVLQNFKIKGLGFSLKEGIGQIPNCIRSGLIGLGIGILPGIGGGTSNILAYTVAKNSSKTPEKFGTGIIDGVVASETANNATIGGALIPLLTLGIPGDAVTALLLGSLMVHGLTPGPLLFTNNGPFVYGIFVSSLVANVMMLLAMYLGIRLFARVLMVPKPILLPIIMVLCCVGAYGLNNRVFDVYAVLGFGLLAFALQKGGFPTSPIILGFVLGPMIETNLLRGMMQSEGSFLPFLTRPISAVFLLIAVAVIAWTVTQELRAYYGKKASK
ncbi:MAG: tripartite tricarboxylate transporter permease [Dysosmobacter sp.]|jgi:putative tricarboxylic transport membrane protein|uniref:tripartite tricarboxylate transporter permease n=1 Tax=Dysosmobacter sp. TaxID=2591382 RepID=UPI003D93D073